MSESKLDAAVVDDARHFVASQFGGVDMSDVSPESIRVAVEKLYSGGWEGYVRDFRRFTTTTESAKVEKYSPIKQRAIVGALIRRPLRDYDEIIKFDFDQETGGRFVVSRPSVIDRRSRRDIITEREITLYKFERVEGQWKWDFVDMTEVVHEEHSRYGSINTVQREADKKDQFENCYRPGTDRTPMQGWAARLELSWEQAHKDEVFQQPIKEEK